MEAYTGVYEHLALSAQMMAVATGEIRLPSLPEQPAACYGGPPGLVPLWSYPDGPLVSGLWIQLFTDARTTSYVTCYVELGYEVVEVARSSEQLVTEVCLEEIVSEEGITPELTRLAAQMKVENLEAIYNVAVATGDDLSGLLVLPAFQGDPPLRCCETPGVYHGGFPNKEMDLTDPDTLRTMSALELDESLRMEIQKSDHVPAWLRPHADQISVFDELLAREDVLGCWKCLNSHGWKYGDSRDALHRLVSLTGNELLSALAEAWCSLEHERNGTGY